MQNLINEIYNETKNLGRHPLGSFDPAQIEDIKETTYNGEIKYEIMVRTDKGLQRVDLWQPNAKTAFAKTDRSQEEIKKSYIAGVARFRRLFMDLGLPTPEADDHLKLEKVLATRVVEFKGRICKLNVSEDKRDSQYVRAYIGKSAHLKPGAVSAPATNHGDLTGAPSLDDVPF